MHPRSSEPYYAQALPCSSLSRFLISSLAIVGFAVPGLPVRADTVFSLDFGSPSIIPTLPTGGADAGYSPGPVGGPPTVVAVTTGTGRELDAITFSGPATDKQEILECSFAQRQHLRMSWRLIRLLVW